MPLLQRVVEPIYLSRGAIPVEVPSELECVTNGTLSNIIRQLSSLSKHAEDIFGELFLEATSLIRRTASLQVRIERISLKVTQLDSTVEEGTLQDIHMRKAFKSSVVYDQQVVSRSTIPVAMLETYRQCDKPPPLDKLNSYREDGKDGLKFYTDPNYFFDLWRQEMLKDTERIMMDKGKKPHRPRAEGGGRRNKKVRQPHNTREKFRQNVAQHEFNYNMHQAQVRVDDEIPVHGPLRPSSLELQASYSPEMYNRNSASPTSHYPAPPAYIEHPQYSQYQLPPPYTPNSESPVATSMYMSGRVSAVRNTGTMRPAHPPPAPPSMSASSTPTLSNSSTPMGSKNRMMSNGREALPPPPPPPVETLENGPLPHHLIHKVQPFQIGTPTSRTPPLRRNTPNHIIELREASHSPEDCIPDSMDLPPPPPTPDKEMLKASNSERSPSPPPPPMSTGSSSPLNEVVIPPPPPPPPLPPLANGPLVANGDIAKASPPKSTFEAPKAESPKMVMKSAEQEAHAKPTTNATSQVEDARSDLLAAIREGIKLRKVEDSKQKEVEKQTPPHDVASILARRVAMEFSDSDTASESEYDSEAWDEDGSA